jgi:hypothetical protein
LSVWEPLSPGLPEPWTAWTFFVCSVHSVGVMVGLLCIVHTVGVSTVCTEYHSHPSRPCMYAHTRTAETCTHRTATRQNGGHAQEARPLCPPCTAHAMLCALRGPALPSAVQRTALQRRAAVARIAVPGLDSVISSAFLQRSYSRTSFCSTVRVRGPFPSALCSVSHAVHHDCKDSHVACITITSPPPHDSRLAHLLPSTLPHTTNKKTDTSPPHTLTHSPPPPPLITSHTSPRIGTPIPLPTRPRAWRQQRRRVRSD